MKLSEQVYRDFLQEDFRPGIVHKVSKGYLDDLIALIQQLESQNDEYKARLKGISQRAEDLQQAAMDMETVLNKFRTGG